MEHTPPLTILSALGSAHPPLDMSDLLSAGFPTSQPFMLSQRLPEDEPFPNSDTSHFLGNGKQISVPIQPAGFAFRIPLSQVLASSSVSSTGKTQEKTSPNDGNDDFVEDDSED